ncbi:hypothetical protein TNCV_1374111 [Trichonephila clavipes]|nr:hypothetical protein TNCV_1374111 [Trichonephila clavipes]
MNPCASNIILKQSDKVRNGSHKIHRKPKNQVKLHPKTKQCSLYSSKVRVLPIKEREIVPTEQKVRGQSYLAALKRLMATIRRIRPEYRTESSWCLLHENGPRHTSLIVR